jgi:hypothetical protein
VLLLLLLLLLLPPPPPPSPLNLDATPPSLLTLSCAICSGVGNHLLHMVRAPLLSPPLFCFVLRTKSRLFRIPHLFSFTSVSGRLCILHHRRRLLLRSITRGVQKKHLLFSASAGCLRCLKPPLPIQGSFCLETANNVNEAKQSLPNNLITCFPMNSCTKAGKTPSAIAANNMTSGYGA